MLEPAQQATPEASDRTALALVKWVHTLAWAFFAGCVVGVPAFAAAGRFREALACGVAVAVECGILAANGMRCPLTDVAARYTSDRRANFDIYLPQWLAEHNKTLFGSLYVLGGIVALVLWARSAP